MARYLEIAMSFPTIIWSIPMVLVVLFWGSSLFTGFGLDSGDVDVDMDVDVDVDVDADVDADGIIDAGVFKGLLGFLNVGHVPIAIVFSVLIFQGWSLSMIGTMTVGPWVASILPWTVVATAGFFFATFFTAYLGTALMTRPLRGAFKIHTFHAQEKLIDQVCVVKTSKVTDRMGQAEFKTDGVPLLLSVRCFTKNDLKKGTEAVIIGHDKEKDVYEIAALKPVKNSKSPDA